MSSSIPFDTSQSEWVCTWLSTSQPTSGDAFPFPLEIPTTLNNQTLKQTFRISLGGKKLRLIFSNRYGKQPLKLADSCISVEKQSDLSEPISITFNGDTSATIPAGEILYSDEISLHISSLSIIKLQVYLPELVFLDTFHWDARQFSFLGNGNKTKEKSGYDQKISSRLLLESVHVLPETIGKSIVVIGDSMVDGNGIEMDSYHRWTDFLAERVVSQNIAIVNAGQSGSRLLKEGIGISTLSRFEDDVLNQPGITTCIVQIGLNDLGLAGTALDPSGQIPTFDMLIEGYRQLISMARKKNIDIVGVTIVPLRSADEYGLENFYQPKKELIRQKVNQWMRESSEFHAIIDSDVLIRDPQNVHQLNLQYDSGDHLHLNYKGHLRIAELIFLKKIMIN
ncbi:GDSL-type esterase/lipase family protein [Proteus hauseri]|uniref:GDSL-type esterase/lipase family protein n=1 Tax=Proteus hauseri TaxID=183417 RepID=UPI0010097C4F|nr:GDSL-type esterase/lipase family protein [Proteus hauseri]QAV22074.1 esterase [Proteus hauseri]